MSDFLAALRDKARCRNARIVLAEGEDPRVLAAAAEALQTGLCEPYLVGDRDRLRRAAREAGVDLGEVPILDPATDPELEGLAHGFADRVRERQLKVDDPYALARDPLHYAGLLVFNERAHGAIMGAVATTADTLRAALRTVGVDPRYEVVTSCFLTSFPDGKVMVYADCGVIPVPTAPQLADIAMQAAEAYRLFVGGEPKVALLSFSTLGSARHPEVDRVREAVAILRRRRVDFDFDGELQGDAALVPEVAARKAPGSPVAGRANVLVFPDLNSGNIAYKLSERLAGARAIGPLLRGLERTVHDLSRGCSKDDILDMMAITALDALREDPENGAATED